MKELDATTFPLHGRMLIEASAGTGKTYTISSLYLRLLLGREATLKRPLLPSEILVLTFTIAATDELRSRIRARVKLARDRFNGTSAAGSDPFVDALVSTSQDPTADRKLLSAALQTMDEASIFTIHGFCARVLSEQSFRAGMLFDQDLDGDRDQLLQTAAEDCFRQLVMNADDHERDLAQGVFKSPQDIVDKVKSFLYRHNLTYLPEKRAIKDALRTLIEDDQRCKAMWLEHEVSQLIRDAGFHGGRATSLQVKPTHKDFIEHYCRSPWFDLNRWEPWSKEKLKANRTAKTQDIEHPIFDLIDSILERRSLLEDFKTNLFHDVAGSLLNHLQQSKTNLGQLTLDDLLVEVHRSLNSHELRETLRSQWPAAMIDEFQDTDDLQFEIFTRIYASDSDSTLLFIGDPKQAIYNFRGADVFTYLNAKLTADDSFSLGTNWRSTSSMVEAVNYLFAKPNVFGDQTPIEFTAARAAEPNHHRQLTIQGTPAPPINVFLDKETHAGQYLDNLMNHAAEETVQLLHMAQQGKALIDGEAISPGQIAFLVRSGRDARAARSALARRGVRSVYVTQESVFLTDTAADLKHILEAVADPSNESAIRAALATRLMQCSISQLNALNRDWSALHQAINEFQAYHQLWNTTDIAPMLERLLVNRNLAEKWLGQTDGERQLTNFRHLSEILQQQSMTAPGMRRLLKWYQREMRSADTMADEARQLRLESDSNLVQIVTMHASKGLEYDVVMMPYAGFGEPRGKQATPLFHIKDSQQQFVPAIDFAGTEPNQKIANKEEFDESLRLMYVALTRAKFRCYLGIPMSSKIHETPIARLLGMTSSDFDDTVDALSKLPESLFERSELHDDTTMYVAAETDAALNPPRPVPKINWSWRMHSYTGLTRLLSQHESPDSTLQPRPAYEDDDRSKTEPASKDVPATRFHFPRGSKVGIALHSFMEHLDFRAPVQQVADEAQKQLAKLGLSDENKLWQQMMVQWFEDIVATPLEPTDLRLSEIEASARLDEMEFHFPIEADQTLISALKDNGVLPSHMTLAVERLQGMMTGYIDLVIRHQGLFYLIDYKSNDLGHEPEDYGEAALTEAIQHHHYDLQYLIYCVALNRYLSQRLNDYDYDAHFGGVRYLFLRGMTGRPGYGVYCDRPPRALIEALDELLTGVAA